MQGSFYISYVSCCGIMLYMWLHIYAMSPCLRTFKNIISNHICFLVFKGSPRELIARLATQGEAKVTPPWTDNWANDVHMEKHTSGTVKLNYTYRVICDHNYYGPACTELCKPRDDKFGHYTCSENGTKACLDGWKGEYCDQGKFVTRKQ